MATYTATRAQIWHEIHRRGAASHRKVVFLLKKDPKKSPYRYRGVPVFSVSFSCSWMDIHEITIIDDDGRPWLVTWERFAAALPGLVAPGPSVSVQVDSGAVGWARNAARDAKRKAALIADRAAWPSQIAALRSEWLPRRKTERRAGYLAAADALATAIDFDFARGEAAYTDDA